MATFGIGMMAQIGFLTHQVTLLTQSVDRLTVSLTVSSTAVSALAGRLALARFANEMDARLTTAAALLIAAGWIMINAEHSLLQKPAPCLSCQVRSPSQRSINKQC
jgi:putative hemolysin